MLQLRLHKNRVFFHIFLIKIDLNCTLKNLNSLSFHSQVNFKKNWIAKPASVHGAIIETIPRVHPVTITCIIDTCFTYNPITVHFIATVLVPGR
jgi:hypothetical protein